MSKKINKSYDNNAHIGINKKESTEGGENIHRTMWWHGIGLHFFFFYFFKTIFLKTQKNTFWHYTCDNEKTRASVKGEVLAIETSYFPTVMGDWPNFLHTRNALSQLEHKTIKISFLRNNSYTRITRNEHISQLRFEVEASARQIKMLNLSFPHLIM